MGVLQDSVSWRGEKSLRPVAHLEPRNELFVARGFRGVEPIIRPTIPAPKPTYPRCGGYAAESGSTRTHIVPVFVQGSSSECRLLVRSGPYSMSPPYTLPI